MAQATQERIANVKKTKKAIIQEWQDFYSKFFGITVDLGSISIPRKRKSYDRVIIIAQGITMNQTLEAMLKQFNVWTACQNDDLDKAIRAGRTSKKSYAIRVIDSIEPEQKYLGKSSYEADPDRKIGVTLLERLVFELKYFTETSQHLDMENFTLCTGSRRSNSHFTPSVAWMRTGELLVSRISSDLANMGGIRSIVS